MKKMLLLIAIAIIVISCSDEKKPETVPAPKIVKVVRDKKEVVASRYNVLTQKQVIRTDFYLVSTDGKVIEVDLTEYMKAEIGKEFAAYWY